MSWTEEIYAAHGGKYAEQEWKEAAEQTRIAAEEKQRPSVLFQPDIFIDGDQWCALYGDNLQDGVAGFGDTPEEAMRNFDSNWRGDD